MTNTVGLPSFTAAGSATRQDDSLRQHHTVLRYRPDIDGLRAVAVFAVIAFHLHFSGTPGGFVGVDVFFVISGYLITAILYKDLLLSRFSIGAFYERRILRILPALTTVLIASCALAYVYLLPADLENFSRALSATAFSASNIYFFFESNYFSASNPLLHTWSLAVEEQFYIFFPMLLTFAFRYRRKGVLLIIGGFALLSFTVSIFCQTRHPVANFYMPYTRAWELFAGSLLSVGRFPCPLKRIFREILALCGAALIAFSILKYSELMPFPGLTAVPPCLGAVLLIYAGEGGPTIIGQVLSWSPVTFLGAISYSLYLWHWPLLFFSGSGFLHFNSLSHRANVALYLCECIGLAVIGWKFVENPFRGRKLAITRSALFISAGATLLAFAAVGGSVVLNHGLAFRYSAAALRIAAEANKQPERDKDFRSGQCFLLPKDSFQDFSPATCLQQDPHRRNVLLLGDSHAAALWKGLVTELPQVNFLQVTSYNCKPFPTQAAPQMCGQLMKYIYGNYLPANRVDGLMITARWKSRDLPQIASLVQWCSQRHLPLFVVGPAEEYDNKLPVLLAYAIRKQDPNLPYRHRITEVEGLDRRMQNEARQIWHVTYVSLIHNECSADSCLVYADRDHTSSVLFDNDHYTFAGARLVIGRAVQQGEFADVIGTTPKPVTR